MQTIGLDFETYYDQDYTLRKLTTDGYILDARYKTHGVGIRWPDGDMRWYAGAEVEPALASIDWGDTALLCHNTHFDGFILSHRYGIYPAFYLDTMAMGRALWGVDVGASLDKISRHLNLGIKGKELLNTKGIRDLTPEQSDELGRYCLNDVHLMWEIWKIARTKFNVDELRLIDLNVRKFTKPCLMLNKDGIKRFRDGILGRKNDLLNSLGVSTKELRSDAKFAELLMGLGIDPPTKWSDAQKQQVWAFAKTDPGMKELLDHEVDEVRWLAEARLGSKSMTDETRAKRFLDVAEDDRPWPVLLNYWGAHPGRYSGGNKQNPQNLRRGGILRDNIEAPPGHVIVVADSAQIEARDNAFVWGEQWMIDAFARGDDIYSLFGSENVYGRTITKADKDERQLSKTAVLGLGYNMGPPKFKSTLALGTLGPPVHITEEFSEQVVSAYRSKCRRIVGGWRMMHDALPYLQAGETRDFGPFRIEPEGMCLPNGLHIRYPDLKQDDSGEWTYARKGKRVRVYGGKMDENYIQGRCRCIVAHQMLQVDKEFRRRDGIKGEIWRVATMSHDEIVSVVPEWAAERTLKFMIAVMRVPPPWAKGLPLNAEGGFGKTYGEAK